MLTSFRMGRSIRPLSVRWNSVLNSKATGTEDVKNSSKSADDHLKEDERWAEDDKPSTKSENEPLKFPEYGNKPKGPEPTRFGDWQYKGRSTDF